MFTVGVPESKLNYILPKARIIRYYFYLLFGRHSKWLLPPSKYQRPTDLQEVCWIARDFVSIAFSFHFTTFIWQLRVWLGSPSSASFLFSFFYSPSHSLLVRPTPNRHIESNSEKMVKNISSACSYLFYQKLFRIWKHIRSIDKVEKKNVEISWQKNNIN